ncbi:MAG: SRPBCC family protein [Bacteroidales bacterium]|nr:SRPBCC family protein [Bacteroidales bacterium]
MLQLESKTGTIFSSDEKIFNFLTDFDNFKDLIPGDKIRNWKSDGDSCYFSVDGLGDTGVKILEKDPYKTLKLTGIDNKFDFFFWVQLKQVAENDTKVRLTVKADINPMMQMMAKKPLQSFLDTLIDQLGKIQF